MESTLRRDFHPTEEDRDHLEQLGLPWEAVLEGGIRRLVIYSFPLPLGYGRDTVDLYVRLEAGYPDTQLDMVYFLPHLALESGRPIGAISADNFDGKSWQRWSRHRTGENPWNPAVDNLETHLLLVKFWLEREVNGGAA